MGPLLPALFFGGIAVAMVSRRTDENPQIHPPYAPRLKELPRGPTSRALGPMPKMYTGTETKKSLSNLMVQPLDVAVEAARHRWGRNKSVNSVMQGSVEIIIELDPLGTDALMIPREYLGWPVKMVDAKT